MAGDEYNVAIALDTIGEGKLNEEFQSVLPGLLAQLREGDKAGVTISVEFKRVENTTSMIGVTYKITVKAPPRAKASICRLTSDFKLQGKEPSRIKQVTLLERKAESSE